MNLENETFNELLYAVATGNLDDIVKCINKGVSINRQDNGGYTPLMLAARMGVEESVVLLLDNGANPDILDNLNKTAAMIATEAGFRNIADVIEERRKEPHDYDVPESVKEVAIETFVREKADEIKKKLEESTSGKSADEKKIVEANNLNLVLFAEAGELSGWLDEDTRAEINGYLGELNDVFEKTAKNAKRKLEKIRIDKTGEYDLSPVFETDSRLLKRITREIYNSLTLFASSQLGIPRDEISLKYEEYHERLVNMRNALLVSARDDGTAGRKTKSKTENVAYAIGKIIDM